MVNRDTLQKAIAAHARWKTRLRDAIDSEKLDVPVSAIKTDNQCEFGKWLYGSELATEEKGTAHYKEVKELHARFHQEAAKVAELALSGKKDAAEAVMGASGDYGRASADLTLAVSRWRDST